MASIPHFINSRVILEYFSKSEKISANFYVRCVATKININNFYSDLNKVNLFTSITPNNYLISSQNLVENVITLGTEGYS